MDYVGVDPGVTTGVAFLMQHGTIAGEEYTDPLKCMRRLLLCDPVKTAYVIERYYGGGRQSKDGELTLRIVGYFEYRLMEEKRVVVMQSPQMRKSQLTEAKSRFPLDAQRHMADALAHALAYRAKERR